MNLPGTSRVRALVRRILDAFAFRVAVRLASMRPVTQVEQQEPDGPAPTMPPPPSSGIADLIQLGREIAGGQQMLTYHTLNRLDRSLLLQGRIAAAQLTNLGKIRHIADVEFRVCSQWGEDGIIEWLCQRLPNISRSFIEFGVENFAEANSRFLMENRAWRGLVFDGSVSHMTGLRSDALYWRHDLTAVPAFITAENINQLIIDHGFAGDLGILSVDIDGNDYWVLDAIDCVNPAVIVCEINGVFGDMKAISVPYRPDFYRMDAHFSGQYFGCSIAAAKLACSRKGYSFIGTNNNGVNAFFVRDDLAASLLPLIEDVSGRAPRHRDSRDMNGELDFVRGLRRYDLIADMPVVDLETGRLVALNELQPLYSDAFLQDFR